MSEQRAEDSLAQVLQTGDRNNASITQREDSPPTENFYAGIGQYGNDGVSSIDQDGDDHFALNEQWGDNNASSIVQTGSDHWANVQQITNNNASAVAQAGVGNIAIVVQ